MKCTVLGDYGGYPFNNIGTSGYLISSGDYNLLMDCGSGVLMSLEQVLDPLKLNAVVLSHYHADHIADVGVLEYYWQLHQQRFTQPILPIYGNTDETVHFDALNWPASTKGVPYHDGETLKVGPFSLKFLKTIHPVPAYAIRIQDDETKKTLCYTADTRYFDGLVDFVKDCDLLIADTNFYADKQGRLWHMTSTQSGRLARLAQAKHLMLSHLPQYGNHQDLLKQAKKEAGEKVQVFLPAIRKTFSV